MKRLLESNRIRRLLAPTVTRVRQSPTLLALSRRANQRSSGTRPNWQAGQEAVDSRYLVDFQAMLPAGFDRIVALISHCDSPIVPYFQRALELLGLEGEGHDPGRDDFHDRILADTDQLLLCRPRHSTNQHRQLYWDKILPLYDLPTVRISPPRAEHL